ncbi:hypothetical protein, partial [Streptomyces sp. NPDC005486]|uniref:hypothetical protein n=1 Tax=Streptomyces sp. NPDC005486 TaxID=3155345 RepID=UPI0033A53253
CAKRLWTVRQRHTVRVSRILVITAAHSRDLRGRARTTGESWHGTGTPVDAPAHRPRMIEW